MFFVFLFFFLENKDIITFNSLENINNKFLHTNLTTELLVSDTQILTRSPSILFIEVIFYYNMWLIILLRLNPINLDGFEVSEYHQGWIISKLARSLHSREYDASEWFSRKEKGINFSVLINRTNNCSNIMSQNM